MAHALDLVGERWGLLVVRELFLGPKRFTDLRAGIVHASPNVLAQRLRELERHGIVCRRRLPPPAAAQVYELTDWGRELEPVLVGLGRWGARSPALPLEDPVSPDSQVLALAALFDARAADGMSARFELRLGERRYRLRVADGVLDLQAAAGEDPHAVIETDRETLAALLWAGRPLTEALASGDIAIEGDVAAVERLLPLFPLPRPAEAAAA